MTTTTTPEERAAAIEVLRRIERRIERGWTTGAYARDEDGYEVNATDADACSWCLSGAMIAGWADSGQPHLRAYDAVLAALERQIGPCNRAGWNDFPGRTQSEVLAAVRAARERLERQPE